MIENRSQRIEVEGLGRNACRLAQFLRPGRAGQAARLQQFARVDVPGNHLIHLFQRPQRRKETGHQVRLEVANAQVHGRKLDVGRGVVVGRQQKPLLPQHATDLVEFQAAQRRQPLLEFRGAEALLLGQAAERFMHPRVEEQLPTVEQDLAARPLLENFAAGTFQQDDVLRQVLRGTESDLAAIGDFPQGIPGDDVALAVRHAKTHARQRRVQPHHPSQKPRRHEPRRRLDRRDGPLQFRQADPRILGCGERFAASAEPFPEVFHECGSGGLELGT